MSSSKLMIKFIIVAMLAISSDLFCVETGINVQASPPTCERDCTKKFLTQECDKYCVSLSYKRSVCILSEGFPPKTSTYRRCC
ncbi:hypothetical protein AtEden1_Chr1g0026701 [Arabidopsis thaliana]